MWTQLLPAASVVAEPRERIWTVVVVLAAAAAVVCQQEHWPSPSTFGFGFVISAVVVQDLDCELVTAVDSGVVEEGASVVVAFAVVAAVFAVQLAAVAYVVDFLAVVAVVAAAVAGVLMVEAAAVGFAQMIAGVAAAVEWVGIAVVVVAVPLLQWIAVEQLAAAVVEQWLELEAPQGVPSSDRARACGMPTCPN